MRLGRVMYMTGREFDKVDRSSNELVPPGKELACQLRSELEEVVEKCSSVDQRSLYGWEFTVRINARSYLIVFQIGRDNMVDISQIGLLNFWYGRKSSMDSMNELCTVVESVVLSKWELSNVSWKDGFFEFSL